MLLLYLAISGIFMLKGKLGFKWRGAVLISLGVAVPVIAVMTSSPQPKQADDPAEVKAADIKPAEDNGIKFLPPEPDSFIDDHDVGRRHATEARVPCERVADDVAQYDLVGDVRGIDGPLAETSSS